MDVKQELFESHVDEIKQELIECEEPKLQHSDLLIKVDQDCVRECELKYFQNVPIHIKKERKVTDLYVGLNDIKQEPSEFVQLKSETELLASLTTHCDLPTVKDESTAHPSSLVQQSNNKQAERIYKSLKDSHIHVSKMKKKMYPRPVGQNIFRSPREKLSNTQFGMKCYETCYYCGQLFLTKSQLLSHFIVFHCVKKVTKFCRRKFRQDKHCRCKNCLNTFRHSPSPKVFHSNEKLLRCKICFKKFPTEVKLNYHLKKRNCKNLLKCEICLKQFTYKSNLKMHLKIHTGEKPFKCGICLKHFTQNSSLETHLKIHTGETPFKCEICSKLFRQKGHLNDHLKIHTGEKPFKCEICSKLFRQKVHLNDHLKIHTGEKPFKCEICLKQFTIKRYLHDHLKIHTGEKPFKCEICPKQFIYKSALKSHLKKRHAVKCEIYSV